MTLLADEVIALAMAQTASVIPIAQLLVVTGSVGPSPVMAVWDVNVGQSLKMPVKTSTPTAGCRRAKIVLDVSDRLVPGKTPPVARSTVGTKGG